jgi:two-component SAPR family response regulator
MPADHSDRQQIEKRLADSSKKMRDMVSMVSLARQVKSYDSDRRKQILAKYMVKYLKDGDSATAAEANARADSGYFEELNMLAEEYKTAEGVLAKHDAEERSWETARSLLSFQREMMRTLPES